MADLRERLGALDEVQVPDLWTDIEGRDPRRPPVRDRSGVRRTLVATLALLVAAAAIAFTAHAFLGRRATSVVVSPGPSADQRILAVRRDSTTGFQALVAVDPRTGGTTVLSTGSFDGTGPSWSPEGGRLVLERGISEGYGALDVRSADGSLVRTLPIDKVLDPQETTWSPDGATIAFTTNTGEIEVLAPDGSGLRQITRSGGPCGDWRLAWSPDSTRIAYVRDCDAGWRGSSLRIVDVATGKVSILTTGGVALQDVSWSPDGSKLAFGDITMSGTEVATIRADGSNLRVLTSNGEYASPAWSPDGRTIAFLRAVGDAHSIWIMSADGSGQRELSRPSGCVVPNGSTCGVSPTWSADGAAIAYVQFEGGVSSIWVADRDGTGQRQLVGSQTAYFLGLAWRSLPGTPAPSPTGARAPAGATNGEIWARVGGGDGPSYLYSVQPDGSDQKLLFGDGRDPSEPVSTVNPAAVGEDYAWSPDGTRVAFTHAVDMGYEIFTMAADGSDLTQVTHDRGIDSGPTWSPDGERLAYARAAPNPDAPAGCWGTVLCPADIYVIDADGSGETRLTTDPADDSEPAWSPDGSTIAFAHSSGGPTDIFAMSADGTDITRLTDSRNVDVEPSWSPDGSRIAFLAGVGDRFEVGMMDADGSDQRVFLPAGLEAIDDVAWSPDGAELALAGTDAHTGSTYQVWLAPAVGGAARQVSRFDRDSGGLAWRPIDLAYLPVCDFKVGDSITFGSAGAVVPAPGHGVAGVADGAHGGSSITIETSPDGVVTIEPGHKRCRLPQTP